MTYVEMFDMIFPGFPYQPIRKQVAVAISMAAEAIRTEPEDAPLHEQRAIWARAARKTGPETLTSQFMFQVFTRPVIAAKGNDATDAEVQAVVNEIVNDFVQ